jgi:hypothetical protein
MNVVFTCAIACLMPPVTSRIWVVASETFPNCVKCGTFSIPYCRRKSIVCHYGKSIRSIPFETVLVSGVTVSVMCVVLLFLVVLEYCISESYCVWKHYYCFRRHSLYMNFMYYFTTCFDSLRPSSGKIFALAFYFAVIFPYIAQCLQLEEVVRIICQC